MLLHHTIPPMMKETTVIMHYVLKQEANIRHSFVLLTIPAVYLFDEMLLPLTFGRLMFVPQPPTSEEDGKIESDACVHIIYSIYIHILSYPTNSTNLLNIYKCVCVPACLSVCALIALKRLDLFA